MKPLTLCQANRIKVKVRTVRRHPAGPAMKLLTCCQENSIKVGVRIIKRHSAGLAMKSLTTCQANRSGNEDSQKVPSWTCHEITHFLSRQQEWKWGQTEGTWHLDLKTTHSLWDNSTRVGVRLVRRHQLGLMTSNHTQAVKPTEPEEGWEQSKGTYML